MRRVTVAWTPEMDAKLIELREQGYGYHAAGEKIGVANYVVERRVRALGLPTWGRRGGRRFLGPRATLNAARTKI